MAVSPAPPAKRDPFISKSFAMWAGGILAGLALLSGDLSPSERQEFLLGYAFVFFLLRTMYWFWSPYRGASDAHAASEFQRFVAEAQADSRQFVGIEGHGFEDAVQRIFSRLGWDAQRTPYSGDGGWDITLRKDSALHLVECKAYGYGKVVGRPALQKLHSAMMTNGASNGIVVSTTGFSVPAETFAKAHGITLIDGPALLALHKQAYPEENPNGNDTLTALCPKCGEVFSFLIDGASYFVSCPRGHSVQNPLHALLHAQAVDQSRRLRRQMKQQLRDRRQRLQ